MTRKGPRLEVDLAIEPGASPIAEGETELTALLTLRMVVPEGSTPAPLHLAIAPIGPGAINGPPVARALEMLRAGDRLSFTGGRTHVISGSETPQSFAAWVEEAFHRPCDSAASALALGREALLADRKTDVAHRLILVAHSPIVEPVEPLLAAATALTEKQFGLDLFTTTQSTDLGTLIRLANLGGGDVAFVEGTNGLETALRQRLAILTRQFVIDPRIELEFVQSVVPGRMFRASPSPIFLGNVRLTPTDRRLVLDPGPISPGKEPSFVLTMTVPRRRTGNYRVVEVTARHRAGQRLASSSQGGLIHRVTDDPIEAGVVEAGVVEARDRVEPSGWVEEAARAFLEGDHRRVANTLERLARRLLELGRSAESHAAIESRGRYLRSGHLDRSELNRLRRLAASC